MKLSAKDINYKQAHKTFLAAYVAAGTPKDSWYHEAHDDVKLLADYYDKPFHVVAAVVAVLSPQQRWDWLTKKGWIYPNLNTAVVVLHAYVNGYDISNIFGIGKGGGFGSNKRKAWAILESNDASLVSGEKVTSFYNNLLDPDNEDYVTIDQWMARAYAENPKLNSDFIGAVYGKIAYPILSDAIKDIAYAFKVVPNIVQAGIWNYTRLQAGESVRNFDTSLV